MSPTSDRWGSLLRRTVNVRPGEGKALAWSFAYFFFLLGGYSMLRPVRDQMAIARDLDNLKWLFLYTFVVMLVAVPIYGALVRRAPKARIVPFVYRFFVANLILFWAFIEISGRPALAGTVFFVWLSVFNLFVVSVFWSVLNDRFDTGQAKRLFPFIAAGGSIGALTGPTFVALFVEATGPVNLLLIAAVVLEISLICLRGLLANTKDTNGSAEPAEPSQSAIGGSVWGGLKLVAGSRYLAGVALFFLFMTGVATLLYYMRAHFVGAVTTDPAARTQIFALTDILSQTLTLLLQFFIAGRLFQRFGVGWGLMALPLVVMGGFAIMAFGPTLVAIALFDAARRATQYALARPARENLFTPLDVEAKYKAKNFIDTAVYRGGDAGSIWVFSWLRAVGVDFATMAGWMIVVAGLWLGTAFVLGRRHGRMSPPRIPPDTGERGAGSAPLIPKAAAKGAER